MAPNRRAAEMGILFPVEAGRCHQALAGIAEPGGNADAVREHLNAPSDAFFQYGAKLYLDQVIVKKQILKA